MRLFVGGYSSYIQGERFDLGGDLEFSAAHNARSPLLQCADTRALLDSGAFTDAPEARLSPEGALTRQLAWERRTAAKSGLEDWRVDSLVSYDRLIDETWLGGVRYKARWSVRAAESAVTETIGAARFLAEKRMQLQPRILILSCQGVDATQYQECAREVLKVARPGDWIGLGGWCILGLFKSWLPEFWRTLQLILPEIRAAGITHVHIFGVCWLPALGGLLWLADEHGLTVSTDSAKPTRDSTRGCPKKAGMREPYWRDNVAWWVRTCQSLRSTEHYQRPDVSTRSTRRRVLTPASRPPDAGKPGAPARRA